MSPLFSVDTHEVTALLGEVLWPKVNGAGEG